MTRGPTFSLTRNGVPAAALPLGEAEVTGAEPVTVNELQPYAFQVEDREPGAEYRVWVGDRDPEPGDGALAPRPVGVPPALERDLRVLDAALPRRARVERLVRRRELVHDDLAVRDVAVVQHRDGVLGSTASDARHRTRPPRPAPTPCSRAPCPARSRPPGPRACGGRVGENGRS